MLAPGLKKTDATPEEYWRSQFESDLLRVAHGVTIQFRGARGGCHRIPVTSLMPQRQPRAEIYAGVARRFRGLDEQRWFLGSLFVSQMAAQTFPAEYYKGPAAVLVGLLGGYYSIQHPGYLLLVLAMYKEAVLSPETGPGLKELVAAQARDLESWSRGMGERLTEAVRWEVREGAITDDLYPFRTEQPPQYTWDREAVTNWRQVLHEVAWEPPRQGDLFGQRG